MSPVDAPLCPAGLPHLLGKLPEFVIVSDEPEPDDARPHVTGDDQLHLTVSQTVAVGPSSVGNLFHNFSLS